jgi:hypothetical protein
MYMDMLNEMLNKVPYILLIMSILNIVRHLYYFIQAWVKSDSENPEKYKVSTVSLWILSISIAYFLTFWF